MPSRHHRVLAVAAVASSLLVLVLALAGHPELLAYAAPVLVLALPLAAGRYLGEERLERLRETPARRLLPVAALAGPRRGASRLPRGGRLIAHSMAERGPPLGSLT